VTRYGVSGCTVFITGAPRPVLTSELEFERRNGAGMTTWGDSDPRSIKRICECVSVAWS
jgi:hypothetical protein